MFKKQTSKRALALLAGSALASAPSAAQETTLATPAPATTTTAVVPTEVDTVERGLRARIDLNGRYRSALLPAPPVRLEVDEVVNDDDDLDVSGLVIVGYDRPFDIPLRADFMGRLNFDVGGDSPVSPFLDDTSVTPKARIYSAFIGLSGPGALAPFKINLGHMTEVTTSPITYDGLSAGVDYTFKGMGFARAKLWGGVDAPQFIADDPFTRSDKKAYAETYVDTSGFTSPTGALEIVRTALAPQFNPIGGLTAAGRFYGIGFDVAHTLMPSVQRTRVELSYLLDVELLSLGVALDVKATDFLPRSTSLTSDLLSGDGTTRVALNANLQFLEDACTFDCSYRAFNPAETIDEVNDQGAVISNAQLEALRVKDQIRHLNFGPAQEHIAVSLDAERQLGLGFTGTVRGRLRQHFDPADLDLYRTNLYEGGLGFGFEMGPVFEVGSEIALGLVDSGLQDPVAFDLRAEGLSNYVENRTYVRTTLIEGALYNLTEGFVRRHDVQSKGATALGQYSGGVSTMVRYDVLDFWSVALRADADLLSPFDSYNASGYLSAQLGTSVRF